MTTIRRGSAVAVRARRPLLPLVVVAVAVGAAGYVVRLLVLLHTDGMLGSSAYDDGVYYAASASLVHGRWPYADFLFLQPPAILLVGAPSAALGALLGDPAGVVIARLAWIGIGASGCALVAGIAGRRSLPAGIIAGACAACFYPLAYGERSTLLEPLGTVVLLVAILIRERGTPRAALLAGAIAGTAVDVKIWYVVPVLVLAAFPRHRLRFLLGAVAGGALVVAPFLIRAPEALVRQVVLDQLGRPRLPTDTLRIRVTAMTGVPWMNSGTQLEPPASTVAALLVIALIGAAAIGALWRPEGRRAVALLVATSIVLIASPSFFAHYIALTGPWMALVLGIGAGVLLGRVGSRALVAGGTVLLTALVAVPTLPRDLRPPAHTPSLAPIAAAAQRVPGCVRSDDPGLLAAMGVLSRDLGRGCEVWPDVTGWTYEREGFPTVSADRPSSAVWQRFVTRYLLGGEAVIVDRKGTGLSRTTLHGIHGLPVLARSGDLVLRAARP
jgi:alpha-1,2-mannosyltransferase